jgi:cell division septation protein DedD
MAWLRLEAMLRLGFAVGFICVLGGCSNTPIGEQLGNSFGSSPDLPKAKSQSQALPKPTLPPPKPELPKAEPAKPEAKQLELQKPLAPAAAPVPYRVVLRLPATDPAAPAEALTKALRAANLPFEVETIERVRQGDGR